jgi:DNA repair exonuclease SbcCD nuclease subunit
MSSFRFVHAADIHLDSPLHGLSRYDGLPIDEIRGATRAAFDKLIAFTIESEAAFMVIAGDLFDGDWRDMGTGLHFNAGMSRLARAGISTYIGFGNHDALSVVKKALPVPDKVHFFSTRGPEMVRIPELGVVIHGWSFGQTHVSDDVTPRYTAPDKSAFNVGVLHTSLGGYAEHIAYAPCALPSLVAKEYQYWALGHVHDHAVLSEHPFVVYPGNLQGRHVRETGPKGAVLVEVRDHIVESVTHVPLDVVRWHLVEVDCTDLTDEIDLHRRAKSRLHEACVDGSGLTAIARVVLTGTTELSDRFVDKGPALRDEMRALAVQVSPDICIEKLSVRTRPPTAVLGASLDEMNVGAMLANALGDEGLAEALKVNFRQFMSSLRPSADGGDEGLLLLARAEKWDEVAAAAAAALRARLTGVT